MKSVVAVIEYGGHDGEFLGGIWDSWEDFHSDTFSPEYETHFCYDFTTKGKTYADRKEYVRNFAIDWSNLGFLYEGWSYGELGIIQSEFERLGRQYGLLKEFHENCIC